MKNSLLRIPIYFWLLLIAFLLPRCSWALTREAIMETAERYKAHAWVPTESNVCHTAAVDTPDRNTHVGWIADKGWKWEKQNGVYVANVGVPYDWGGADTLQKFDDGVGNHLCAGNIDTEHGAQSAATGVDCSGFVSRVWNLRGRESTRSLPNISKRLASYGELKRGDIVNRVGSHVMLAAEDHPAYSLSVYESSAWDWKVNSRRYESIKALQSQGYVPYTYFRNLDVEILLDRSGSMEGVTLDNAKGAAAQFVDFMNVGDKVGVTSFAVAATVDYPLTRIDGSEPSAVQEAAKAAIRNLVPGGDTSMGTGLLQAQAELETRGTSNGQADPARVIVFFSDGSDNTAPFVRDALPALSASGIRVCTIGIWSDKTLLKQIAQQTGCSYHFAPDYYHLHDVYAEIWSELSGQQPTRKQRLFVQPGKTVNDYFDVDSSVHQATISLAWEGSDVDLSLVAPDGTVIDHSTQDPGVTFVEDATHEYYRIQDPPSGRWQVRGFGKDLPPLGEDAYLFVSFESGLSFQAAFDKERYSLGEPILVTASVEDALLDTADPQLVKQAVISAQVLAPNRSYGFQLLDDGVHGDGAAGDGVFGAYFTNSSREGQYVFTLQAAGLSNRSGEQFVRQEVMTAEVGPQVEPTASLGSSYEGYVGSPVAFDASGSSDAQGLPLLFRWDFDSDGDFDTEWDGAARMEHIFWNAFSGQATVEVKDAAGVKATAQAPLIVHGAREMEEMALADLDELAATGSGNKDLKSAIDSLSKSLADRVWQDDSRLQLDNSTGASFFAQQKSVAVGLEKSKTEESSRAADMDQILGEMIRADEILVRVAFKEKGETAGVIDAALWESWFQQAAARQTAAADLVAAGRYAEAVGEYHLAWSRLMQMGKASVGEGNDLLAVSGLSIYLTRSGACSLFRSII